MRIRLHQLFFFLLLLVLIPKIILGQLPLRNFYFKHIKTEQGLTNGVVWTMMKDKDGYLWIGTYNGLNCFDGSHFKTWKADPSDTLKLPNNSIQGICEDKYGCMWFTSDVGVSRYDKKRNTFKSYKLFNTLNNKEEYGGIYRILNCRNGAIITHTADAVYIFDSLENKFTCYHSKNNYDTAGYNRVNRNSFVEDPFQEGIWIATTSGMRYFDLNTKIFYSKFNNPKHLDLFDTHEITALALNKEKQLIYCDADLQEIRLFDSKRNKATTILSTKSWKDEGVWISTILMDRDNNLWIASYSENLFFVDGKTQKVSEFKNQKENNYSVIGTDNWSIIDEDDGTIYIGGVDGISYTNIRQNFFSIHKFPSGIQHNLHFQIPMLLNCDRQNNVWMAPSNEFVLKCNPENDTYVKYDFLPKDLNYGSAPIKITTMEATAETLYFGTMDGIYAYIVKQDKFQKLTDIPPSEKLEGKYILTMCLTQNNELWFTSHHNGLFRYNIKSHKYTHYLHNPGDSNSYTDNYIFHIHEDLNGTIWIMSEFSGLMKYNPVNDNFIYLMRDKKTALPKEIYTTVINDADNNLWLLNFITGLTVYNPKTNTVKVISSSAGLSHLLYKEMIMDKSYNLWLGTYYQYSILNTNKFTSLNFDVDYGKNTAGYANNFALRDDGLMVSETENGYILFDPRHQSFQGEMQPVNISNFVAGDSVIAFVNNISEINLTYHQNFFSFDFSTLSYLKNPNIRFAYKLEGIDKDWIYCGNRQTAYYTNLSGGDYMLRVKTMNGTGMWLERNNPVQISISKIFYTTMWFKLILFALFTILVNWYYRLWRAKQSREKAEQVIAYFANSVSGGNKVEEILWDITHNVIGRSDFVDCVVYLYDENKNVLVQKAAFGNKNPSAYQIFNPIEIKPGKGIVGSVATTGIAEIVNDTSNDKRYIADDESRLSELAVPIQYEGKLIGVIDSEHPRKNFFTSDHLEMMSTIASISGTKIVNARKEIEIAENEKRLNELKMQMAYTRQQALRAQMNPHFIFNCLNSINGFILQNEASIASTFLIKFSKLIRLILEHSNEKQIALQSELDALKLYIEMEMLRFEKKFSYAINIDPHIMTDTVMVPPLILQPFVENSIWHGLLHKETAGRLQIDLSQINNTLICEVEDNGIGRLLSSALKSKTTTQKKSLGMKLTIERLLLLEEQENRKTSIEIIDLKNEDGSGAGTKVIIKLELNQDI